MISSGNEPCPAAIGAVPAAMASTATSPNVSSQVDGSSTARARATSSAQRSRLTCPVSSTEGRDAAQAATSPASGPPPAMTSRSPGRPGRPGAA